MEFRPAYNLISHGYLGGRNPEGRIIDKCGSLHLRYSFEHSPTSRTGRIYPSLYQGIGIAAYTFGSHNCVGTPLAVYLFQGATLGIISRGPSVGYEWNLGWSWGWVPNEAMNSPWNVLINVGIPIGWQLGNGVELLLTPDFTHFSNGDTSFPNAGTNTFGLRVGITKHLHTPSNHPPRLERLVAPSAELSVKTPRERLVWDLVGYGGWRADRFFSDGKFCVSNRPHPNGGVQLSPLYLLNDHFGLGGSLDIFADTSANLYGAEWDEQTGELVDYQRPSLWEQTSIGLSLRGEWRMGYCSVGVGSGVNIITHGYDMRRYYTTFGLKCFFSERAFLYVGYRLSSLQYTHNIMYGLGWRF